MTRRPIFQLHNFKGEVGFLNFDLQVDHKMPEELVFSSL